MEGKKDEGKEGGRRSVGKKENEGSRIKKEVTEGIKEREENGLKWKPEQKGGEEQNENEVRRKE